MACGPPGSSVRGDSPGRKTVISSSREFPDPGIKPASLYFNVSCTGRRIPYPLGQEGNGLPPGEGNDHPLQCSCLENSKDRGAWWATVHAVAKSRTRLSNFTFTFHFLQYLTIQAHLPLTLFSLPTHPFIQNSSNIFSEPSLVYPECQRI